MTNLTLDQIKDSKKKAQQAIKEILLQFEKETGISDYSVNVDIDKVQLVNGEIITSVRNVNIAIVM